LLCALLHSTILHYVNF